MADAQLQSLAVHQLQPGRYQPRRHFDEKALDELAQSILTQGLIEPLIVREIALSCYEIVAGERRWRAAKLAGLTTVPCLIGQYTDKQAAALTLVENIQREDLNLIEEATGYKRLVDEFHFQQDEIAAIIGKSRSHVANILRLLTLCEAVQTLISQGILSLGHARMLVGLPPEKQIYFANLVETQHWSVRVLEDKIKQEKSNTATFVNPKQDRDIARLEQTLAEQVGAPVKIAAETDAGGWLQVKFFDNDTLAGLLERLGLRYD